MPYPTLLLLAGLLFLPSPHAPAAQIDSLPADLRIGVAEYPPFILRDDAGNWDGLSVQLWRELADDLELTYDFVPLADRNDPTALEQGEVDLLLLSRADAEWEGRFDLSHIYFTDQLGIVRPRQNQLWMVADALLSPQFWRLTSGIFVLLLIVGTIVYFIERGGNEDHFGGKRTIWQGIGSGLWWAGVTMTTIGYGDKAPVTFAGRTVALLWMLVAMLVTSSLTAGLVSALGTDSITGLPDELPQKKIVAVADGLGEYYLREERIGHIATPDLAAGLDSLQAGDVDLVLHSAASLRYQIRNHPEWRYAVSEASVGQQPYAMAFPAGSPLRETVNRRLLHILYSPRWAAWEKRYVK